jgi:hypothetical protein
MMLHLRNAFAAFLALMIGAVHAQQVVISSQSTDLTACGAASTFRVILHNTGLDTLAGVQVVVELPIGVRYLPGSVSGGFSQVSIVQLDSVTFGGPNLLPGQRDTLYYQASAGCGAVAGAVLDGIRVLHSAGTSQTPGQPYSILRPALSVQSITNASITGNVGLSFTRCVTVVNGGFGGLTQFYIVVARDAASLVHTNFRVGASGLPLTTTLQGDSILVAIGPAAIAQVGDLDGILEQNESFQICYNVFVQECFDLTSEIGTYWGCGGNVCEVQTSSANVTVPTLVPNILFSSTYTENRCYGSGPSVIRMVLRNNGTGPARDVLVEVYQSNGLLSALDTSTVMMRSSLSGLSQLHPLPWLPMNQTSTANNACLGTVQIHRFRLRIPFIQAGESDTIWINQPACCKIVCTGASGVNNAFAAATYKDQCLTNAYLIPPTTIVNGSNAVVNSYFLDGDLDIASGDTVQYSIEHTNYQFLRWNTGGYAWIDLIAPPGLFVLTTPLHYRDQQGDLWNPTSVVRIGDTVRAFFNLGPPAAFSTEKSRLIFQVINTCSGGPCSGGPKTVQYKIYEKSSPGCPCNIAVGCFNFTINAHCPCPSLCPNGGMVFMGFDYYRQNYGQPDNNNDGQPDAVGSINKSLVRTRYLTLRDTLFTRFKGVVDVTAANPSWSEGFASSTITQGTFISAVSSTVRIVDVSTGITYNCILPAPTITGTTTKTFRYNLNVANLPCLPLGFAYEDDDTVEVTALYVISSNPGNFQATQSITNQFAMQTVGGGLVAACDNFAGSYVLVGYYYTAQGPGNVYRNGCGDFAVNENYYLSIGLCCSNYGGGNLFEYEYRHWGIPDSAVLILPTGYSFVSAVLSYARTSGSQAVVNSSMAITPYKISGDSVFYNLRSRFVGQGGSWLLGDDGYHGTITTTLRPSCAVVPDVLSRLRCRWGFVPVPALTGAGSATPFIQRDDNLQLEAAVLDINPVLPTAPGLNASATWDFFIENNSNLAAANNAWFAFVSPSGLITPVTVTNLQTNTVINPVGGIYQVGTLIQDGALSFRIRASYANCAGDSLRIVSGWNCAGYPANLGAYTCAVASAWLYIEPQPAVLQATMNMAPGPFGICDSILVDLQVVSSQIASVRNIQVQVTLPLGGGLTYSNLSGQLRYPNGAAFAPMGNPTISGNLLTWNINTVSPVIAARNLPGVINPDSNRFDLRFYLYTDCNLISGDRLRVRVTGIKGCNDPVTPILLLSDPININGAVQPYTTQVAAQASAPANCPETKTITLSVVNSGGLASGAGDSVIVSFGQGYSYAGGFVGLQNSPGNPVPHVITSGAGLGLVWDMPLGLAAGDTMRFSFNVLLGDAVPCGADLVNVQAVTNQSLFCARTGVNCLSSLQTGSTVLNLSIARPDLNFFAFSSTIQPIAGGNDFDFTGTIQNSGLSVSAGTTTEVRFYCDNDNSLGYSTGDVLLGNYTTTAAIPTGGAHNFSGSLLLPSAACPIGNMIFALITPNSAAGLCLCDTAFANTNVVLPVEWLSVQAEALPQANEVSWEATLTTDHAHFVVEKLVGLDWRAVSDPIRDRLEAYQWLDFAPAPTERYRIRATDQNGTVAHSRQVEVVRGLAQMGIKVYPNPATRVVTLEAPEGTRYALVSALGVRLRTGQIDSGHVKVLDISGLAAGVYVLEFQHVGKQVTQRLVIE